MILRNWIFIVRSMRHNRSGQNPKDIDSVKFILRNIDWSFSTPFSVGRSGFHLFDCRKHHWFPATFISEIPFTLIEVLSKPGDVVYDPFGGIGTTFFQALLLNRLPLTIEICKVAVEFMGSLLILFDPNIDLREIKEDVGLTISRFDPQLNYIKNIPEFIHINKLEPWYTKNTLNQLAFLMFQEHISQDRLVKAAMRITLSAILKMTSCQDRGWGCIADNVLPKPSQKKDKNALSLFHNHLNKLINDISKYVKKDDGNYKRIYNEVCRQESIIYKDIRGPNEISDQSVDLVITSPPYSNMTDYVTSQRLSYYWLGVDPTVDLRMEIGARRKRFSRESLELYRQDMKKSMQQICKKIKEDGYMCIIMPMFNTDNENNTIRRAVVQNFLSDLSNYGLILEDEYQRVLPATRRHHNLIWTSLEREKIHLYKMIKP